LAGAHERLKAKADDPEALETLREWYSFRGRDERTAAAATAGR